MRVVFFLVALLSIAGCQYHNVTYITSPAISLRYPVSSFPTPWSQVERFFIILHDFFFVDSTPNQAATIVLNAVYSSGAVISLYFLATCIRVKLAKHEKPAGTTTEGTGTAGKVVRGFLDFLLFLFLSNSIAYATIVPLWLARPSFYQYLFTPSSSASSSSVSSSSSSSARLIHLLLAVLYVVLSLFILHRFLPMLFAYLLAVPSFSLQSSISVSPIWPSIVTFFDPTSSAGAWINHVSSSFLIDWILLSLSISVWSSCNNRSTQGAGLRGIVGVIPMWVVHMLTAGGVAGLQMAAAELKEIVAQGKDEIGGRSEGKKTR